MVGPAVSGSERRDRTPTGFAVGFVQPLGIYLGAVALFAAVEVLGGPSLRDHGYPLQGEAAAILGVLACAFLGVRHQRRGRERTAIGVFVGALVWPVVFVALFLAVAAYRFSHGTFVTP
ncbi:hypothetical protein [Rugosimonospora africana]|uniref:Uncharacterized protein n=1 Tax=Rugosimonospora africana TaxID=556532 RepID=A0A8J3VP41_9ACTN|nr:hypothetical protein [Rugosimonospora africana]GIH12971.1 hypothetical protein Raf01_11430 [Rugosimonospora africana]